jgi:hypothetical protein
MPVWLATVEGRLAAGGGSARVSTRPTDADRVAGTEPVTSPDELLEA